MLVEHRRQFEKSLRRPGVLSDALTYCEKKSGLDRNVIAYGALVILFIYVLIGYGAELLVLLVGFLYPAYQSVKAIETQQKEDDTQWLIYWVVFAFVQLVEGCTFALLTYLPLYSIMKCIFLLHCMAPFNENGSILIYKHIIRPLFVKHSPAIDSALGSAAEMAGNLVENGK
ncbi:Receptor expression-enhancing protein 6 [Fasciolopsis buskii]|uniref:Receptor expression-enhancing protein n=1 Tax=Fasciolopsis buskii TaxID=27845 RepID=A0A8E0S0Z9_9TREM|nr:Receptor expression-enhancing protein 6 [Fasciolopsis buski]